MNLMKKSKKSSVSIGSWITLGHFSIAEIMADAGFDWLCVDMEHSVISYYEAEQFARACQVMTLRDYTIMNKCQQIYELIQKLL